MHSFYIGLFIIFGVIAIDLCLRLTPKDAQDKPRAKSAGLISLLMLILAQRRPSYREKSLVIKRFFLSLFIVIFLVSANYLLLDLGVPKASGILAFSLMLAPLFTAPFYHFLYDILDVHPLSITWILSTFRLRGILALVISANTIFISLNALQHPLAIAGHFFLTFLAILSSFNLVVRLRKKPSPYNAPFQEKDDDLASLFMRYLAAILEIFYYLILTYSIFLSGPLSTFMANDWPYFLLMVTFSVLLFVVTIIVRIRFEGTNVIPSEFYEEKILPLSFFLFGIGSIIRFYFSG